MQYFPMSLKMPFLEASLLELLFSNRFDLQISCKDAHTQQTLHKTKLCVRGSFVTAKPVQAARESSILLRRWGGKRGGATALAELPFGGRQAASFLHLLLNLLRGHESLSSLKHVWEKLFDITEIVYGKGFSKQLSCFLYFSVNPFQELFPDKCCYRLGCIRECSSKNRFDFDLGQRHPQLCSRPPARPRACPLNSLSLF